MPHRNIEPNILVEFFQRVGSQAIGPATLFAFGGAAVQLPVDPVPHWMLISC